MKMSNYPHGFNGGVLLRNHPHMEAAPGKVFFVGNNATLLEGEKIAADNDLGGKGGTFLMPFSTIDYAIGRCVANRGDVIYVRPNYSQTITAADSILLDIAGVSIIGLGNGSDMPEIEFNHADATVGVSADNCSIDGINFNSTITAVTVGVNVKSGADHFRISNCRFDCDTAGTDEFNHCIRFVSGNAYCTVENNTIDMGIAGAVAAIHLDAATDHLVIRNNTIRGDFSSGNILGDTTLSTDILIDKNLLVQGKAGDIGTVAGIVLLTGSHGVISDNYIVCNVATPDLSIVADTCFQFNNFYSETVNAEAVRVNDPALIDSTSNALGVDDADNAFASTNVAANRDGSILERLEAVYAAQVDDVAGNALGFDDANNVFSSSSVVANLDGSILERLEALMDPLGGYDPILGFRVTKTSNLADGAGTDNLFTVTGRCLITHLSGEVTTQVATTTTMKLSDVTNTVDLCAATTITSDVVGTMYALPAVSAQVLNGTGGTPVVGSVPNIATPSAGAGQIIGDVQAALTIAHVLDGAGTGAVAWVLYYKPLTAASSIAAAA
jgi:hypothetical protein